MNLRLLALAGVVACAVALPLAVASAGPVGDGGRRRRTRPGRAPDADGSSRITGPRGERRQGALRAPSPPRLPADCSASGLATAARCGPELTSPDGIEAQTCVLTQGEDTWARTYYRNATGETWTPC